MRAALSRLGCLLFAAALAALWTSAAIAEDRYWISGSGDWNTPGNWSDQEGGPGMASVPGEWDSVYIRTVDSLDREINLAPTAEISTFAGQVEINSLGSGLATLRLSQGSFNTNGLYLGTEGAGRFDQSGGTANIASLQLSRGSGDAAATSIYDLSAGSLTTSALQIGYADSSGLFRQSGGTHTTVDLNIENGRYDMTAGLLRAATIGATGSSATFNQTGGTVEVDEVRGAYNWNGGTIAVRRLLAPWSMSFPSVSSSIYSDGVVDFSYTALSNTRNTSINLGEHAIFTHQADFDPTTAFASYTNAGIDHVDGTPLVIPAGRTIYAAGFLTDPIECRGTLITATPQDTSDSNSVFHVYAGGSLNLTTLRPLGAAEVSGGSLTADYLLLANAGTQLIEENGQIVVGPSVYGSVLQTGGVVTLRALTQVSNSPSSDNGGGTYQLAGGSLFLQLANIGSGALFSTGDRGYFFQTGGLNVVGDVLSIGSGHNATGTYEISAGSLRARTLILSDGAQEFFNQPVTYGVGTLKITNAAADIHIGAELRLGPYAAIGAVRGAAIHFDPGANFTNNSTDPVALAGLAQLHLIFDGAPGSSVGQNTGAQSSLPADSIALSIFEVAGEDRGAAEPGFLNNFALGVLEIGSDGPACLQLVDLFQNHGAAFAEALYIDELILGEGSTFDLSGLNVYVHQFVNNGGSLLQKGGELRVVPEPSSMILGIVLAGSGLRRQRRNTSG